MNKVFRTRQLNNSAYFSSNKKRRITSEVNMEKTDFSDIPIIYDEIDNVETIETISEKQKKTQKKRKTIIEEKI